MTETIDRQELRSVNAKIFARVCRSMLDAPSSGNDRCQRNHLSVQDSELTGDVLAKWAAAGLLGARHSGDEHWPKFNSYELVWLGILKETLRYGLGLETLRRGRGLFSACIAKPDYCWSYMELAQHLVCLRMPVSLMVYSDGHMEFYFGNECSFMPEIGIQALLLWVTGESFVNHAGGQDSKAMDYAQNLKRRGVEVLNCVPSCGNAMMELPSALSLNINHLYARIFCADFIPFAKPQITLNPKEGRLLERIRSGKYDEIDIMMRDGGIDRVKVVKTCLEIAEPVRSVADNIAFGEVVIKKIDGKVASYKQIESVRL